MKTWVTRVYWETLGTRCPQAAPPGLQLPPSPSSEASLVLFPRTPWSRPTPPWAQNGVYLHSGPCETQGGLRQ